MLMSQLCYQVAEDLSRLPCGPAARSGIQWKSVCLIRQQTHYHMVVCSWSDVCSLLHSVFASDAAELPFSLYEVTWSHSFSINKRQVSFSSFHV